MSNYTNESADSGFLPLEVSKMSTVSFDGNVIPHTWYQQLKTASGRTNLAAVIVLAEICY